MASVFRQLVLALIFACCAVALIAPRAAPAADITVILDQARLLKLPERAEIDTPVQESLIVELYSK